MRVIAGRFKGRHLSSPSWAGLRPTSDKLRETIFNVLAPRIVGAQVLDGYAGSGALGIEALSRGAASVAFIENDPRAQALIEENLARCGIRQGCAIIRASVARGLEALRARSAPAGAPSRSVCAVDIALLDPPYEHSLDRRNPQRGECDDLTAVLTVLADLIAPGGIVVLEHARRQTVPEAAGSLVRVREIRSGDSHLTFYGLKTTS